MKPAIIVDNVTKTFHLQTEQRNSLKELFVRGRGKGNSTFTALENVSFSIPEGTTFGLVGHNGSGKSTMLKLLAGVYRPTSGSIKVAGKVDALLELGAGFHGELTGRENIYLNGAILGRSRSEIEDSVDWIINFADIGDFIDAPVKVYSSGMTVRLGFAVAVAVKPKILIVDEIIAVGDEDFQRKCFEHLYQLRAQGTTIALVTHSLALAKELCDQAVWLDHGKVQKLGDVSDVVSCYIQKVNQIESQRRTEEASLLKLEEETGLKMPENVRDNQGSGEARVIDVEYLDANGKSLPIIEPGKTLKMRMKVRALTELKQVELGFAVIHDPSVFIIGPNSRSAGILYDFPVGDSYVEYTLENMPIQDGTYNISTCLRTEGGHLYDYNDRCATFTVRSPEIPDQPGVMKVSGSWSPAPVAIPTHEGEA